MIRIWVGSKQTIDERKKIKKDSRGVKNLKKAIKSMPITQLAIIIEGLRKILDKKAK